MENTSNSIISQTTSPNLNGKARVDLVKSDFDALVWQKGYDVYIDKAIECPCRNKPDGQALSSCKNCGGSGWLFINRTQTKIVLQSMNLDTKYKQWSKEILGTVKITARNEDEIGYMDRITVLNTLMIHSQVLFAKDFGTEKVIKTTYGIKQILDIFLFDETNNPLIRLVEGTDYTIKGGDSNYIVLNDSLYKDENTTVSVRYKHHPQYHLIDMVRGQMSTYVISKDDGQDTSVVMPIHGVGRLSHYVIDENGYNGEGYLLNNSYIKDPCKTITILGKDLDVPIVTSTSTINPYKGLIIFDESDESFKGWDGNEFIVLDNKLIDIWSVNQW